MNVDLMRKVDRYVGIPLCFVSSFIVWVLDKVFPSRTDKPKNILFVELSEMGSTILADPCMKRARAEFEAQLFFVIFKKNKPSLDLIGTIPDENIFTLREDSIFTLILDALRYLFWCRKNNIDTVIDLELFSRVSTLLCAYSGAKRRVGYHNFHGEGLYRGSMVTHKVAYNPHIHISKNFMALIYALMATKEEIPYSKIIVSDKEIELDQVPYSEQQKTDIRKTVKALYPSYDNQKLVLINPNASELLPQRRWPKPMFKELMQRLLEQHEDILILITGAPAEKAEAEQLKLDVNHDRCINYAGQLKLQQMPVLYTISNLMVTNDSGPGHFSAITPLKTFVLFGPETPKLYGSLGNSTSIFAGLACSPCVSAANHRKTPCTEPVCMTAITVDRVFEEVNGELLK